MYYYTIRNVKMKQIKANPAQSGYIYISFLLNCSMAPKGQ